jgi:hypothetical protein
LVDVLSACALIGEAVSIEEGHGILDVGGETGLGGWY